MEKVTTSVKCSCHVLSASFFPKPLPPCRCWCDLAHGFGNTALCVALSHPLNALVNLFCASSVPQRLRAFHFFLFGLGADAIARAAVITYPYSLRPLPAPASNEAAGALRRAQRCSPPCARPPPTIVLEEIAPATPHPPHRTVSPRVATVPCPGLQGSGQITSLPRWSTALWKVGPAIGAIVT